MMGYLKSVCMSKVLSNFIGAVAMVVWLCADSEFEDTTEGQGQATGAAGEGVSSGPVCVGEGGKARCLSLA